MDFPAYFELLRLHTIIYDSELSRAFLPEAVDSVLRCRMSHRDPFRPETAPWAGGGFVNSKMHP